MRARLHTHHCQSVVVGFGVCTAPACLHTHPHPRRRHASLVPVYLAAKFRPHGVYNNARCILAIHNLRHQGVFPPGTFAELDLPGWWYGSVEWQYPPHERKGAYEEEGRAVNHLKVGLSLSLRGLSMGGLSVGGR